MDAENVRVKDRVELALDGRQIASIVVGALVLLGVVFVLGLNVGRQIAVKQLEASRGDALAALDQPPPPPRDDAALTFHDRLTKERPSVEAPPTAPPAPAGSPAETLAASAAAALPPPVEGAPAARVEQAAGPKPPAGAEPKPSGRGAFAVQVVSTTNRAEADKLAARLKDYSPRVESADVPGKGRYYRVRVGSFRSKPEAERFLEGFASKSGSKGLVVAAR